MYGYMGDVVCVMLCLDGVCDVCDVGYDSVCDFVWWND